MMENFSILRREKVTKIQETQRVLSRKNTKRPTARHIIIKRAKIPRQREDLKGSKGETASNIQGSPNKASSCLLNGNAPHQKGMARNIPSNENQRPATKTTTSSNTLN